MKKLLLLLLLVCQTSFAENKTNVFQTIRFKGVNAVDVILELDDDAKTCGLNKPELLRSANFILNQSRLVKIDSSAEDYIALNITTLPTSYDEGKAPSCFFVTQIEFNRLISFKDKRIYASVWENSLLNYAVTSEGEGDMQSGSKKESKESKERKISNQKLIESVLQKLVSSFLNEVENANH
jgi:hypothetical protein